MAAMIEKPDRQAEGSGRAESDLLRRLVDHLDMLKRPNDLVRVTQVSKNHFRVNTLTPSLAPDSVMPTYRIVKSQFLLAEDRLGELVIVDQTRS
jgi:hypothetical protein